MLLRAKARDGALKLNRIEDHPDGPIFNVFVLGTRASGKSILISCLQQHLSTMGRTSNFFIRASNAQHRAKLTKIHAQLLDPAAEWPAGSVGMEAYEFKACYNSQGRGFPLFRLRYDDYPGGYVTDGELSGQEYIAERIDQANSVLVLLDGRKIRLRLDEKEKSGLESLHHDLDLLVPTLQSCIGRPLHFAITKCDILNPAVHTLEAVFLELLEHPGFANIIAQQEGAGPSYLVPISAVGPRFADFDIETGTVVKRPDGVVRPVNLELLIALMLVDVIRKFNRFTIDAGELSKPDEDKLRRSGWILQSVQFGRIWAPAVGSVLGPLSIPVVHTICNLAEKRFAESGKTLQQKVDDVRKTIDGQKSPLEAVLEIQALLVEDFLNSNPGARLSDTPPYDPNPKPMTSEENKAQPAGWKSTCLFVCIAIVLLFLLVVFAGLS